MKKTILLLIGFLAVAYIAFGAAPSISSVVLNSTDQSNETSVNLTCYPTTSDSDSHNVTPMYSWYKNSVLNATTSPFRIDSSNLVGYWPFDNDALDYALSNNCTLVGSPMHRVGKVGNAYNFSGVGDNMNCGSHK